jgi:hypothetical protein
MMMITNKPTGECPKNGKPDLVFSGATFAKVVITAPDCDHSLFFTNDADARVFKNLKISSRMAPGDRLVYVDDSVYVHAHGADKEVRADSERLSAEHSVPRAVVYAAQRKAKDKQAEDTGTTPPVRVQHLLSIVLGGEAAEAALGDLQELFEQRANTSGLASARRYYWKHALFLVARRWIHAAASRLAGMRQRG